MTCKNDDGGGSVSDFGVLTLCDVDERLCGRMNDVQELHDGSAVVGNRRRSTPVDHQLVHAARSERRSDSVDDDLAGVDVRDDLQGKWQKYVRKTIASLLKGFYGHFIKRHIIIQKKKNHLLASYYFLLQKERKTPSYKCA